MAFTFQGHASAATTSGSTLTNLGLALSGTAAVSTVGRGELLGTASFTGKASLRTGGVLAEAPFAASHPELVGTITPDRQVTERERLEGYLKTPFETPTDPAGGYEATDYGALVGTAGAFAHAVATTRNNVLAAHYVDYASGRALDEMGHGLMTPRRDGEEDPPYRRRIKAAGRRLTGGGTIDEIIELAATLLAVDESAIHFAEPFSVEPARFTIGIDRDDLDGAAISDEEFIETIRASKAGGVKVVGVKRGMFIHRSEVDFEAGVNNSDLAYDIAQYAELLPPAIDFGAFTHRSEADLLHDVNGPGLAYDYGEYSDLRDPALVSELRSTILPGESVQTDAGVEDERESPLAVGGALSVGGKLTVRE